MKIALVQVSSPVEETPSARRSRVSRLVADARGADLIVLPELWAVGYFNFDAYVAHAETLDGPTVTVGRQWARELNAYVHLGSLVERDSLGRLFNTAVLLDRRGDIVHTYRKMHMFGYHSDEPQLLTPGEDIAVVDTPVGRVTTAICYDLRFPELWREAVDRGAHLAVLPAAWSASRAAHWQLLTSARAVEQQMLVVACNAVGGQQENRLAGLSRVIDPWGQILTEAPIDQECVTLCDIDPVVVQQVRAEFPALADRRRSRLDRARTLDMARY